jgi:hypothetical protein
MTKPKSVAEPANPVANSTATTILEIRNAPVVIDHEVARLFGTETKMLNQQVTRNAEKFADDYAFKLTKEECDDLRSQNVTSTAEWGGSRCLPRVFTEHGVVMAA